MPLVHAKNEASAELLQLKQGGGIGTLPPPAPPTDNSLQMVFERYLATRVQLR